jgi:predicted ATPase
MVDGCTIEHIIEREFVGYQLVFDMWGAPDLPVHAVSEGTLITLGILTAIMQDASGHGVLLIDDIERAIHPRALVDLVAQLRHMLEIFPALQILATSHSPYLVDLCKPEEVRLMLADESGSAICARLDQHPEFERWIEFMRPGEIWSMVGESWIGPEAAPGHD